MSGRKYIGTIVFNQNIDQYSKSKKESLKREIYDKMVSNEYFIKNIELGGGHFLSHKNKTIKLKGDKAFVEFKKTVSPYNDTYKKKNKDKTMFNWAQKNFKRSMNFNKKMFLDDSLKAVKISVKKDIKGGMEGVDLSGMVEIEEEEEKKQLPQGIKLPSGGYAEPYLEKGKNIIIKGEEGDMFVSNAPEWLSQGLIRQNSKIDIVPDKKVEKDIKDILEPEETKTNTKTKISSGPKKTITKYKSKSKSKAQLKSKNKRLKSKTRLKSKNKRYNKTKKKTRKTAKTRQSKKNMDGGVEPLIMGVGGLTALGAAGAYGLRKYKKMKAKKQRMINF
tara:strand:- start:156 stop:1154 length:999 start_codon:yes stop_codon:yes gene_type:complete